MITDYRMKKAKQLDNWKCPKCDGTGTRWYKTEDDRLATRRCPDCNNGVTDEALEQVANSIKVSNDEKLKESSLIKPSSDELVANCSERNVSGYRNTNWEDYAKKIWDLIISDDIRGTRALIRTKYNNTTRADELHYLSSILEYSLLARGYHGHRYSASSIFGTNKDLNKTMLETDEYVILDLDAAPATTDKNSKAVDRVINSADDDCAIYLIQRYDWSEGGEWPLFDDIHAEKKDNLPAEGMYF